MLIDAVPSVNTICITGPFMTAIIKHDMFYRERNLVMLIYFAKVSVS